MLMLWRQAAVAISLLCLGVHGFEPPPPGLANGKYTVVSQGIVASFIPYAASITNLYIKDKHGQWRDIVLGYDNASYYAVDPIHPQYGAVPGRYANRIVNATYELDGIQYFTARNNGNSTMHSGTNGWSYRQWDVEEYNSSTIVFSLRDTSFSSEGMPGLVLGHATYTLSPMTWSLHLSAEAKTHRTPLMLTNHAYWQLDGFANPANNSVLDYTLYTPYANRLTPWNAQATGPNGTISHIAPYSLNDFYTRPKYIGANASSPDWVGICSPGFGGYDCGYVMTSPPMSMCDPVATLSSEWSGIQWDLYTNQAAFAMTSCGFVPDGLLPLKETQGTQGELGKGFVPPYGCLAFEPQDWTDGISFPEWGREKEQIWGPEDGIYSNKMEYRFSVKR